MVTQLNTIYAVFDKIKDTFETQDSMLDMVSVSTPDASELQNTGNVIWYPTRMHRPTFDGFDMTGNDQTIIQEGYPSFLGDPNNDIVTQRADEMRNSRFWEQSIEESGKKLGSTLNKRIAEAIRTQGSIHFRSSESSAWDYITNAQVAMDERQLYESERYFLLNPRNAKKFGSDLAARQTLQGRSEYTWKEGALYDPIAGFNVMTGKFLPNLTGGATPDTAVDGDQSFSPEAGTTTNAKTGTVANVDYRTATIAVDDSSSYAVNDKIKFINTATDVKAVGLDDKTDTGQAMTFTIVEKPTSTSIRIYPKPIAADDTSLTELEQAYANIDTQILDNAIVRRLNIDADVKTDLFWDKSAIEVMGGTLPAERFKEFGGMKVINSTLSNGLELYFFYDGDIHTMNLTYRAFIWYGITVCNPSNCGVGTTFS